MRIFRIFLFLPKFRSEVDRTNSRFLLWRAVTRINHALGIVSEKNTAASEGTRSWRSASDEKEGEGTTPAVGRV